MSVATSINRFARRVGSTGLVVVVSIGLFLALFAVAGRAAAGLSPATDHSQAARGIWQTRAVANGHWSAPTSGAVANGQWHIPSRGAVANGTWHAPSHA